MLGRTLSHYRVLEQIGAGGMGVVYRAHDQRLERDVAVKVLPMGMLADDAARRRFRREALTLSKLNHPNVATVFDFDSHEGNDFLVTEYIAGESLDAKLAAGALSSKEVIGLGMQLAEGLTAAHSQGVVHRDLKPANLRLTPDGRLKILDFGLAQLVQTGTGLTRTVSLTSSQQITGTLPYMAPEQLRGEATDARSDIWATGAVLYELSTGRRPFPETHGPVLIDSILNRSPNPPSKVNAAVAPGLESIILKALEKEPDKRYQTSRELAVDLERLTTGMKPLATGEKKPWLAVAAMVVVIAAVGGYFILHRGKTPPPATPPAVSGRRSVAVLGFKNLSGRPDTAWLSTALAEMLTTELAAGEKLRTISGENVARVKTDLSLPETDTLAPDTLARVRKNLGSDFVVLGSYLDLGRGGDDQVRLDLRVQDAAAGQTIAVVSAKGTEAQLDDLITRAGAELRQKLGVGEVPAAEELAVKASLPSNVQASRFLAEGLEKLRHFDMLAARDLLLKAVAADPQHAPSYVALSAAWNSLGYDSKAIEAARQAYQLAPRLRTEERLQVEGQYYVASDQLEKAIATYQALTALSPDNVDYGVRLAHAQVTGGKPNDALATIAALRKLPSPQNEDLRIDLAETRAAHWLSDFKREQAVAVALAQKADAQGARLLAARAHSAECLALRNLGDAKSAIPACQRAQQISATAGDRFGVATALNGVGNALYDLGDLERAKSTYAEVVRIDREIGNESGLAGALDNMASVVGDQGDAASAKKLSQQALEIYRAIGDKINVAATLNNIAAALVAEGDFAGTEKLFEEALAIGREIESPTAIGTALTNMGEIRLDLGDSAGARQAYEESLATFRKNGEKMKSAYPMVGLGDVLASTGDLAGAKDQYQQALAVTRESGEKHESAIALSGLGTVLLHQGNLAEARKQYEEALVLRKELGEKDAVSDSRLDLARVSMEDGRAGEVEADLRKIADEIHVQKAPDREASGRALLAQVLASQGKLRDAQAQIAQCTGLTARSQHRGIRLQVQIAAARVQGVKQTDVALASLHGAIQDAKKFGFVNYELEARLALGEIEVRSGKASGLAGLEALEKEARAKGFVLIADKAKRARG